MPRRSQTCSSQVLLVRVEQEEHAGPVPVDAHLAGELEEDVLLAVEQPARALPQVGPLLLEPEDLGQHVLGRGHVGGVLVTGRLRVSGDSRRSACMTLRTSSQLSMRRHGPAVLVDRQQVEHLRRDADAQRSLRGSMPAVRDHLAGGGGDGLPELVGVLLGPVGARVVDLVGLVGRLHDAALQVGQHRLVAAGAGVVGQDVLLRHPVTPPSRRRPRARQPCRAWRTSAARRAGR